MICAMAGSVKIIPVVTHYLPSLIEIFSNILRAPSMVCKVFTFSVLCSACEGYVRGNLNIRWAFVTSDAI